MDINGTAGRHDEVLADDRTKQIKAALPHDLDLAVPAAYLKGLMLQFAGFDPSTRR